MVMIKADSCPLHVRIEKRHWSPLTITETRSGKVWLEDLVMFRLLSWNRQHCQYDRHCRNGHEHANVRSSTVYWPSTLDLSIDEESYQPVSLYRKNRWFVKRITSSTDATEEDEHLDIRWMQRLKLSELALIAQLFTWLRTFCKKIIARVKYIQGLTSGSLV